MNVVQAAAIFLPLVSALMKEAESTGMSGAQKHQAVATAAEQLYRRLQEGNTVKELKAIPWEAIAPLVVPAAGGLISVLASMFNSLWGKVWSLFRSAPADE